ncbi:polysaccharide biosynthesis tyrosine autokinase [Qipengyuania sp. GH1]|uniref:GumC family protein n=1 Tax=Qipengyuania aestuarii TaxID=2867241 RepID=UPI001C8687BF|nr:polysaccharide biosynthesis tyrosine autokinase [Qipengyuania aestuarii]MBX7535469.1 polysaccharide biosynthesis tyrosine autokinase [Qipengyuania aestuarii]
MNNSSLPTSLPAATTNVLPTAQDDGQMAVDLARLWRRAIEKRFLIIGILISAILAAIAITTLQTPLYRSTAQIEISRADIATGAVVEGEALPGVEARDLQYYNTQYELLNSRASALNVVEALDLGQNPAFLNAYAIDSNQISDDLAAAILLANVQVLPVAGSNLVDIIYSSPDARLSAEIANSWATEFLQANFQKRFGDTILARRQLENQLQEMRVKLENSEARLNSYANSNEIIVTESSSSNGDTTRGTLLSSQLTSISDALAQATIRRISAESAMRTGLPVEGSEVSANSPELAQAEAQLAQLRTTHGPQHPLVEAKRAEIESLRKARRDVIGNSGRTREAAYRSALREEQELRRGYEEVKARYLGQQNSGVEYGILEREVRTNREIYDGLLQRYKQLGTVTSGTNNMSVVEAARPAGSPYFPSLLWNLLIAIGIAILVSVAIVYILDLLDQTIRDPEDVKRRFGLRLFGIIPLSDQPVQTSLEERHSILSEAYASTRTSLQFLAREQGLKSLMFTSTHPGEGKTSSTFAIAKSFVDVGERVALIDMDLRRRGLSKLIADRPTARNGVAAYLGNSDESAALTTHSLGFDYLATGATDISPVVLLNGPKLGKLINQLEREYDRIIIDGPPVIGLADALEIGSHVDGIVYILQANAGSYRAIGRALSRLRESDANILGGILTQVDSRNESYGYGYEYIYSYRDEEGQ